MKRFAIVSVLVVFAIAVLAACEPATTELADEQKAEITAELLALHDSINLAVLNLDVDGYLALHDNSEDFTWTKHGILRRGWSTLAEESQTVMGAMASADVCEISDTHLQILASDIAVMTGMWTGSGTLTTGDPWYIKHTFTTVCVKRDGQWKIINYSETFEQPTPEG